MIVLPSRTEQPVFLIIAGPNGSGKSSVYANADLEMEGRSVWIVNPDLLAARISRVEAKPLLEANLTAVQRIEAWLEASISVHKTIGVETVLSTAKYRRLVEAAKALGFAIWFLYVVLDSPERSIERIKFRVAKGGHPVPDEKVRQRYQRSLEQFPWFLEQADKAWIWDNSGASPKTIGEKSDGIIELDENALKVIARAVQSIATE
ncbi:zeta toxin family protein [Rhizobium sp. CC-YZS058]|uniref:zeta toxin family protein n=1 Tax=Rhizobium sp. CC-YZS058 TaxID=3042153 RepID=UPI002B0530A1|nr:zeta toxin family protein [Rhizobium sp. CC-YZS058]MEA3537159.1 zeta toxin family protein [Rhizobium sp. CC-YZS058]